MDVEEDKNSVILRELPSWRPVWGNETISKQDKTKTKTKNLNMSWAWQHMTVTLVFGRLRLDANQILGHWVS